MPSRFLATYLAYQAASTANLFQAVYFIYYEERAGLGLATILALQSYNTGLRALLDLPFGALADRTSRRRCLVAACACVLLGTAVLLLRPTLAGVWVAETVFAFASALRSGADSALLFDTLRARDALPEYARAESRGQAAASLASGLAAVAGGVLAAVDLRLPFVLTLLTSAAALVAAARLEERRPSGPAPARPRLTEAGSYALHTPAVRWTIATAALAVTGSHVYFYLQQPYLRAVGVPIALFGFIFAATKGVTALVASSAHRVDARLGQRAAVSLMTIVPTLGLGFMAALFTPRWGPVGAAAILSRGLLDGLWMPLANIYLNRQVSSRLRATMLSLQNVVGRLTLSAVLAGLGLVTSYLGLRVSLAVIAVAVGVIGGTLVARAPRDLARAAGR